MINLCFALGLAMSVLVFDAHLVVAVSALFGFLFGRWIERGES